MSMTPDIESCKLVDDRLLCIDFKMAEQFECHYDGVKVHGRKYPTMTSAENLVPTNCE